MDTASDTTTIPKERVRAGGEEKYMGQELTPKELAIPNLF
jgi:hypothetical protein